LAVLWAIGCLLLNGYDVFQDSISFIDLPYLIFGLILAVSGVVLLVWVNLSLFKSQGRDNTARIVLVLLLGVWFWFYFNLGPTLRWIALQHPDYEGEILHLQQLTRSKQDDYCKKNRCTIDSSDGIWRVCFTEKGGMLGNSIGIVYDPSGKIATAAQKAKDGSPLDTPQTHWVRELFHGYVQDATPLGGPWFRCDFGD